MKTQLLLVIACLMLIGCETTADKQRAAIEADYKAGKMSAAEYHNLILQVDSSERAGMEALASSLQDNGNSQPYTDYMRQKEERRKSSNIYPMPQPKDMSPKGYRIMDEEGNTKSYTVTPSY